VHLVRTPINVFLEARLAPNEAFLADVFQDWWLPNQLLCFGFGLLLFNWMEKGALPAPGLAAMTLMALSSPWGTTVFCLFLLAFFVLSAQIRIGPLERIGQASYSIYLLHFAVIDLVIHYLGLKTAQEVGFFLVVGVATFLSLVLVKPYIEDPSIRLGKRIGHRLSPEKYVPSTAKHATS
jgi:peptidoglycan/LPS O-acetylase OafA/YrhL